MHLIPIPLPGGLLTGLPSAAFGAYLLARLMIHAMLIVHATRGATPTQRIDLIRAYLARTTPTPAARARAPRNSLARRHQ